MGKQIIKKDDGKYAVFSSIVDDIVLDDATKEEIYQYFFDIHIKIQTIELNSIFEDIEDSNRQPYGKFTLTYKEAAQQGILNADYESEDE